MSESVDHPAVFISSAPENISDAKKLFHELNQAGFQPWLDAESLLPGQRRDVEIRRAIRESRFFVVLLSSHSVKRGKVNREVARALEAFDEFAESDIFIIPARLDESTPSHEILNKLESIDLYPDWDAGFQKILLAIRAATGAETAPEGETGASAAGRKGGSEAASISSNSSASSNAAPSDAERVKTGGGHAASSGESEKPPSLIPAFTGLLILIGFFVGVGFLAKGPLFSLAERYSRDFSVFAVYTGFAVISLMAAVIMFGIVRSTGVFKKTGKKEQFEFGGAMAGFLVTLMFLVTTYALNTSAPVFLEIKGNVRFMQEGQAVGPVYGATVSVSGISGHRGETDKDGNFVLKLPEDQQVQKIELLVKYENGTFYHTVQRGEAGSVVIGIPLKDAAKNDTADTAKKNGPDVKITGDKNEVNISGGDMTISDGE